jgi:hypothetical protein
MKNNEKLGSCLMDANHFISLFFIQGLDSILSYDLIGHNTATGVFLVSLFY